jgi:hypothetical protein
MLLLCCFLLPLRSSGQGAVIINLAQLDGIDLTPDNLVRFEVQSGLSYSSKALITGRIRYRNSGMSISYRFTYTLMPGMNRIDPRFVSPQYTYSSPALRELFEQYKKLPAGIYEYCVTVEPDYQLGEQQHETFNECLYHRSAEVFLINLLDPPDKAKIHETHPVLSWTANYPFLSSLTYRLRVAEIKKGQNTVTAIQRNRPVFDQNGLTQMSLMYPIYARPLELNQPYAWTVDAYYKGILLGGAESWQFTIIEDSLLSGIPRDPSFIAIKRESGKYKLYAPGILKLKYDLKELKTDSLSLTLLDKHQKPVKLKTPSLHAVYGDNRFIIDFKTQPLKHLQNYSLIIHSQTGKTYRILFQYVNPDYIR